MKKITEFEDLKGQYIDKIVIKGKGEEACVYFYMLDLIYELRHYQECCESVELVDVCGDVEDFSNNIIRRAECNTRDVDTEDGELTYSFYRLDSDKGSLVLRWTGESNGYYSQEVDFGLFSPYNKHGEEEPDYENYCEAAQWVGYYHDKGLTEYRVALYDKQLECLERD